MQNVRSSLTRLKTLAEKRLPNSKDILGFAGISKEMITSFIDDAHRFSYQLADLEPNFEIIALKRKLSSLITSAKKYLEDDIESSWNKESKFDEFVTAIINIRDQIRLTYLAVIDKGLKTEAETNRILEENKALDEANQEYREKLSILETIAENIATAHKSSLVNSQDISTYFANSEKSAEAIAALERKTEASFSLITKLEDEIRQKREAIANTTERITSLETKSSALIDETRESKETITQANNHLSETLEKIKEHQQEIQETIEGANRIGMAGSFKTRKDELNSPIRLWGGIFIIAIIAIFLVGYHFLSPYLQTNATFDKIDVLVKIALVSPFIWLAWMSVKQYGYLSRIQEDYAYKFASAMAFEGYKKQAKEINEDLLNQLLIVSVDNLSQNPIRLFSSRDNHASPANEITKDILSLFRKKQAPTSTDEVE